MGRKMEKKEERKLRKKRKGKEKKGKGQEEEEGVNECWKYLHGLVQELAITF